MLSGINKVNEYFKQDKIKIFRNCENTIREIENWKWRKLKPGIMKNEPDEPMDKDDHCCDSLRYLTMAVISKPDLHKEEIVQPNSPWAKSQEIKHRREEFVH
jgi:phage terminase large subunit